MLKFIPYVLKSLWRHRARTLLTVSGTAVALLVFCFIGAVQQGLLAITTGEDAGRTLIVFQENRFCPLSSRLPQDYGMTIAKLPGVKDVIPIKVFTNNCRASLDAIVFQGMPPARCRSDGGQMDLLRTARRCCASWKECCHQTRAVRGR